MDERAGSGTPPPHGSAPGSIPGSAAGDQVGLGRVIEDRREATGSPDLEDPSTKGDAAVEEASEDSFPASDPPPFMSDTPTSRDPEREPIEAPRPDEVP
ncbi:MAG TPA: hypothetical protein VFY23_07875 [Candidatus Limnocylindrales bacterium]|nr:hypothetical protein [Candidatus Limnocylindrales bacterium]